MGPLTPGTARTPRTPWAAAACSMTVPMNEMVTGPAPSRARRAAKSIRNSRLIWSMRVLPISSRSRNRVASLDRPASQLKEVGEVKVDQIANCVTGARMRDGDPGRGPIGIWPLTMAVT
jgi:hypothetical protein